MPKNSSTLYRAKVRTAPIGYGRRVNYHSNGIFPQNSRKAHLSQSSQEAQYFAIAKSARASIKSITFRPPLFYLQINYNIFFYKNQVLALNGGEHDVI
jgi:hypothetical protein